MKKQENKIFENFMQTFQLFIAINLQFEIPMLVKTIFLSFYGIFRQVLKSFTLRFKRLKMLKISNFYTILLYMILILLKFQI